VNIIGDVVKKGYFVHQKEKGSGESWKEVQILTLRPPVSF